MNAFWCNFDKILSTKNKSRRWLAIKTGISESTIATWIAKNTLPRADVLLNLANALGVKIDYLLGNDIDEEDIMTDDEKALLEKYRGLDGIEKGKLDSFLGYLVKERENEEKKNESVG